MKLAARFLPLLALLPVLAALPPRPAQADPLPPVSTPAVTPPPAATPAPGGLPFSLPDPKQWAGEVFNQVLLNLLQAIAGVLHQVLGSMLASPLNFITQTPPAGSYASPTVQALWGIVRTIANAGLALVALGGGFHLIAREQMGSPYHEAMEFFPRLALGALLVNTSLSWGQLAIDANNALCTAIGQATLPAWQATDSTSIVLADVVGLLIYLVTGLLLAIQMLMRLALIDVLLVAAPLGLLCWVLPQTQGWARLWSGTFFSAVFTQFVQVLALKLGGALLADLAPVSPDLGFLTLLLGIGILALTFQIPALMRAHLRDGLGWVRTYVVRESVRALDDLRGGG